MRTYVWNWWWLYLSIWQKLFIHNLLYSNLSFIWRYISKRSHIKSKNQKSNANVTIWLFNVVAKLTKLQYTYTPSKNSNRMTYSKLWCLIYILVSKKLISCLTRFDKKCFLVIRMPIRLKTFFPTRCIAHNWTHFSHQVHC